MNKKKLLGYSIFFIVLIAFFFVFVFWGTDNWKYKPPVLSQVQPFEFINQDGARFTQNNMLGKVCVVNYFFTTCKGICPRMNTNMHKIYDAFKNEQNFLIVSHTCDPERDSAPVLKKYADSLKVNTNKWVFLTGRKDSLYKAARNSYLLDDPKNAVVNINDQFLHTQFFALIDKNGKVRAQIFDGLKQQDLDELKKDIQILLSERPDQTSFSNGIFTNNPQ